MKDFLFGFTYPFRSLKFFFSHSVLIKYSIAPMLINLLIYGSVFILSYSWFTSSIEGWLGIEGTEAGFWLKFLHTALLIIGFILLLFICYLLFTILGNIITAPFNEEISQRVEEIVTGTKEGHKMGFWEDAYISIKGEIQKLAFYLIILLLIFSLNLIPVAGSVLSSILGVIFSSYYNALDFLDYPMTRKKMRFRDKLKVTGKGRLITYGFGFISFLLLFLPVINVFMKPILVVAGTSLFYEKGYSSQELFKNS
ncbi:MAG: EI24 domain-containing protein [Ignavibacteria bacterium]|nr:EI24 domain-containing protein [Ignavibacteria bacterium]